MNTTQSGTRHTWEREREREEEIPTCKHYVEFSSHVMMA
jgi:hypothetical protein